MENWDSCGVCSNNKLQYHYIHFRSTRFKPMVLVTLHLSVKTVAFADFNYLTLYFDFSLERVSDSAFEAYEG